jgi:hypothetical protein
MPAGLEGRDGHKLIFGNMLQGSMGLEWGGS